jgi:hypothetical protein
MNIPFSGYNDLYLDLYNLSAYFLGDLKPGILENICVKYTYLNLNFTSN